MENLELEIIEKLFELQDIKYKNFHQRLIPTVDENLVIGVRTPILRKFAKDFSKDERADEFLHLLPHKYYEENNLHAFLISEIKDYDKAITLCDEFLPFIDNWATCDMFSPKCFKKHPKEVYEKIKQWIKSDRTYTVRYAIVTLLSNYLDNEFDKEMLKLVSDVKSDEYYINMAIAWYFSIALVKQYDAVLPYITEKKLSAWVHNKSIQKAVESFRISDERKKHLKTLKIKQK